MDRTLNNRKHSHFFLVSHSCYTHDCFCIGYHACWPMQHLIPFPGGRAGSVSCGNTILPGLSTVSCFVPMCWFGLANRVHTPQTDGSGYHLQMLSIPRLEIQGQQPIPQLCLSTFMWSESFHPTTAPGMKAPSLRTPLRLSPFLHYHPAQIPCSESLS